MDCKYKIDALTREVYLISDVAVDGQELIIDINTPSTTLDSAYRLKTLTTNITEETQRNGEKTEFIHELTFKLYGLNRNLMDVIMSYNHFGFKTEDGDIFVLNPQMPLYVTYDVELDENKNLVTTFHCPVKSNFPFIPVESITTIGDMDGYDTCDYGIEAYITLECNRKCYSRRFGDEIRTVEGEPFIQIGFLKNSIKYTERYDGRTTTEELTFSLPLDSGMEHYKFIENDPKNRWSFIIRMGDYLVPIGFNNGMVAGYSTEGNNEDGSVSMTFTDKYDSGMKTDTYQSIRKTEAVGVIWKYIKDESRYYAKDRMQFLLQQAEDAFGNKLDEYKSFGDLSFEDYNIVGHFNDVATYEDQYARNPKFIDTNLSSMVFYKLGEEKTFVIKTNYESWDLSCSSSSITISPDQGQGNGEWTITITNGIDPNDGDDGDISLRIFDPSLVNGEEEQSFRFDVMKKPSDDIFPSGTVFNTDYRPKLFSIPFNCSVTAVQGSDAYVDGNAIIVPLGENTTAYRHTNDVVVTTEYGNYNVRVIQGGAIRRWLKTGETCDGNDLREVLRLYISDVPTYETKLGNVIESDYCKDADIIDVETGNTYCDGSNSWKIIETRRSYDDWVTYEVIDNKLGDWTGSCSANLTYDWSLSQKTGEYEGRECYLYIKTFFNQGTHVGGAVVPWTFSPDGDGTQTVVYVDD